MNGQLASFIQQQMPDVRRLVPLSQGGQKMVFSGTHVSDGAVVVKVILPGQDVETVRREIIAVRQVGSARVPEILDVGTLSTQFGNLIWLRERQVVGASVRDALQAGPLARDSVLRLGLHVLEALVAAENVQIVHRDVKPDNLMRDRQGDFWLLDFGLARHLTLCSLTATALPFGKVTWGYSPPEQCRNLKPDIDARADLFALGVTLYEAAVGVNPFRAGLANPLDMLHRVERSALPALNLGGRAEREFRDLVDAMTQKRRNHRPQSASEAWQWMQYVCQLEGIV